MSLSIVKAWWELPDRIAVVFSRDVGFVPRAEISADADLGEFSVSRAAGRDFSKYTSYHIENGAITFHLDGGNFCNVRTSPDAEYFVCGDFNGWGSAIGNPEWKLRKAQNCTRSLTVPIEKIGPARRKRYFKFACADGRWLEPRADLPNFERDKNGNSNLRISLDKTGGHVFTITFQKRAPLSARVRLSFPELGLECSVSPAQLLLQSRSGAPLGARLENGDTVFSIFAPRASAARVVWKIAGENLGRVAAASKDGDGVWTARVSGDLSGARYFWSVDGINRDNTTRFDRNVKIPDPYANAMDAVAGVSIVKFDSALPRACGGFTPPKWHDLSILEIHLRDVLARARADISAGERLTFAGLAKWLESPDCYLRKAGVNCVELQPIQEFTAARRTDYEWGYMPIGWFAPSSCYASDPERASQNADFARLVEAFHKAGLAVVLDVVYNHFGEPNTLRNVDSEYYFETDLAGNFTNYSGCGNDFRCSAPMAKRMIFDSLEKLVLNYGVDGFRFDLAELVGLGTLSEIEERLKKIKPSIILIAEPWSFHGHIAAARRDTGFASWTAGFRECMLSYVLGNGGFGGFKYYVSGSQNIARFAAQTVNYLESHDDKCLFDRITRAHDNPSETDLRRYKIAYALVFLSAGIPMAAEGFDLARTKRGKNNTYKDGAANALDYARAMRFTGLCQWLRSLAKFRNSESARALKIDGAVPDGWIEFFGARESNAACAMFNAKKESPARRVFAAFNPTTSHVKIEVGEGLAKNFRQIADIDRFDTSGLDNPEPPFAGGALSMPALSMSLWLEK